jgi:hypothetical protein
LLGHFWTLEKWETGRAWLMPSAMSGRVRYSGGSIGYRLAPLTTKSTSCPSQAEQRKRRAQSVTAVSAFQLPTSWWRSAEAHKLLNRMNLM